MMRAAAEAAARAAGEFGVARPLCLGVTVLTSLDRRALQAELRVPRASELTCSISPVWRGRPGWMGAWRRPRRSGSCARPGAALGDRDTGHSTRRSRRRPEAHRHARSGHRGRRGLHRGRPPHHRRRRPVAAAREILAEVAGRPTARRGDAAVAGMRRRSHCLRARARPPAAPNHDQPLNTPFCRSTRRARLPGRHEDRQSPLAAGGQGRPVVEDSPAKGRRAEELPVSRW